jgi:hypothetical protein
LQRAITGIESLGQQAIFKLADFTHEFSHLRRTYGRNASGTLLTDGRARKRLAAQ